MSWLALSKMATHSSAPAKHQLEIPTASTPTRKENNMNSSTYMYMYHSIAGNYQGRELNFTVWALATREIFSMKFGHATPTYMIGLAIPQKVSSQNAHFLPINVSFLPQKFPAVQ